MRKTALCAGLLMLACVSQVAFAQAAPAHPPARPATGAAAAPPAKDAKSTKDPSAADFPPNMNVAGSALQLTGWGTRKRFGFRVYHVALYVQDKSANPADYLALTKRERLVLRFTRELDNEQFTRIMLAALKERVNMRETPTVVDSMQKFSELFSSVPLFKVGDEVHLTMLPGGRMEFSINGDTKGFNPITEPPLARGILSIFIGPKPIDDTLKRDILEGGPKAVDYLNTVPGAAR